MRDLPSKWENKAVNCRIVIPYCMLTIANMLFIKGAYGFAFYDEKVFRQGRYASRHGNIVVSTQLNWRFAKMKR
ncbi:MAG: hypothetical protein JW863_20115 [Chitinispirillaceae bacterium]|nr:hypothetical protein [Chitinispirillaceae bacterium]